MYYSYWLHESGRLYRSSDPRLNPSEPGWEMIGEGEFKRLKNVADLAMHGWYDVNQVPAESTQNHYDNEFPVYYDAQGREHAEY